MAIKDIESEIKKEGSKEIKRINKIADNNVKIIEEAIEKHAKNEAEKVRKESENKAELMRRQIIAEANIRGKQMIETRKNELIDQVFDNTKMQILGLEDKEKKEILQGLAETGKKSIKDAEIIVDKKYEKLLKGAKSQDLGDFGVVLQSKDGKVKVVNTLNNRLKQMETDLRPRVAEVLFA